MKIINSSICKKPVLMQDKYLSNSTKHEYVQFKLFFSACYSASVCLLVG